MKWNKRLIILIIIVLLVVICISDARKRRIPSRLKKINRNTKTKLPKLKNQKQLLLLQTRETSPPNFVTLLLFRLIYGIATQMGIEERLPSFIAPPNADEGDYGFFNFDGGDAPSIFGGDDDYDLGL